MYVCLSIYSAGIIKPMALGTVIVYVLLEIKCIKYSKTSSVGAMVKDAALDNL